MTPEVFGSSRDRVCGHEQRGYEIYMQAEPQAIWNAITKPEWTTKYGYEGPVDYRFFFTDAMKEEGFTRITWEIGPTQSWFTRLTVTHELEGALIMANMVASRFNEMGTGGWPWILSDLKSLLETGKRMGGA